MDRLERLLVEQERAACAELVRAAGCLCWIIRDGDAGFGGVIKTRAELEPLRRPDRLDPEPSEPPCEEFP